ncbi:MAG: TIM barrel protein [Planctomycetota bacterium]
MIRRDAMKVGAAAGVGALAASAAVSAAEQAAAKPFKLHYAPHFGMFQQSAGEDPVAQLEFAAEQGFTAWEDNNMRRRSVDDHNRIAKAMERLGMRMGVFVVRYSQEIDFAGSDEGLREKVLDDVRASVEVAKRVNAKWATLVPGFYDRSKEWGYQTANCVELLRRCAEIAEPAGLVLVLEPLNWWTNHAGMFLHKIPQAYEICRAVDSPSVKILFDVYHQQIEEGNLIPNFDMAWSEVAYVQVGDNPGRKEPGTGEINYRNVFKHLHGKGFDGVVGMEHGNSLPGKKGERAVIDAYRAADAF